MTVPAGIVLVSHSPELALGLLALVRQFGDGTVPFVAAGGTDDGRLGVGSGGGVDPRRSPAISPRWWPPPRRRAPPPS